MECLRRREADVLRFLTDTAISPTPSQAARDRYAIRGYISAVAKHGARILTAIHDALAGNPWIPPVPEPP